MGISDTARRLWLGGGSDTDTAVDFHDSSVLADILVASSLQNGGVAPWQFTVPAAYRGAQILADLAGTLPWHAYRGGTDDGARRNETAERLPENPSVLVRPDPVVTRSDFVRQIVLSLIWRGNAYLYKTGMVEGRPSSVRVLDPDRVLVQWNDTNTMPEYRYSAMPDPIPNSQIDHLALNRVPGRLVGVGPFDAGYDLLKGQIAADKFARDLFTRDGIPSGKLTHPGRLTGPEAEQLLEAWQKGQQDGRKTAILSGGMDYEPISLTPDQAQMLQSRAFGVSDIARLLGIPAHLLNASTGVAGSSGSSMTYTNVRDTWVELARMTLFPVYLKRIEEVVSDWLPRGQSVRFDLDSLTRADQTTRYAAHEIALRAGFLTVDEVRGMEDLEPSQELAADREASRQMASAISGEDTDE